MACFPERSDWRSETWPCSTVKGAAGCSDPKTASGTGEKMKGGCRQTRRAAWSARHAAITTSAATVSASSAASV